MDTTGTFEMATALGGNKIMCALHKHYSVEEITAWASEHKDIQEYVCLSSGTSEADFKKLQECVAKTDIPNICLDVANGYSEHFVEVVKKTRKHFPKHTIMAGK
jgi:GMP reductase